MVLALLGYLIQEWNILQIVLSLIVLCLTVPCLLVPESPRWLIADDKRSKAFVVLNRGANINGREFTSKKFEKLFATPSVQTITTSEAEKMGFKTLFQNWYIAKNTMALSINFMVCSLCYYGLAMNQVNLGSNIYVSFVLGGLVEIIGYLFAYLTIDHMGRKTVLIFCQVVAGISCIVGGVIDDNESELVLVLSLIGTNRHCQLPNKGSNRIANCAICYLLQNK
jgi:MFS family permease